MKNGFTLMELMVTVAIVAILAAVVYPSYMTSVQKSRRSDATVALTSAAQALERYYTEQNTYGTATLGNSSPSTDVYGTTSQNGYYTLSFAAGTQTSTGFTLQAAPVAGTTQATDGCNTFTLKSDGTKGVAGGSISDPMTCWGK